VTIANLFCLLTGFALLARHFEKSHVPVILPKFLPADWKGGFLMLVMVFVLSSFLDNIAAALIGGAMAHQLFKARCISATWPPSSRPRMPAVPARWWATRPRP
jgi:Na+/H+ antiporter NhaD/arsenite permease-like protein